MRTLIHFDENAYNDQVLQYNTLTSEVQKVVNAYDALGLEPLAPNELQKLFTTPVDLVFDKMTNGQALSIAGIELHKDKAIEILKKPDGYEALLETVKTVSSYLGKNDLNIQNINTLNITTYFELTTENEVIVKESYLTKLIGNFEKYAESDTANKALAFAKAFIQIAEETGCKDMIIQDIIGFIKETLETRTSIYTPKEILVNVHGIVRFNNK